MAASFAARAQANVTMRYSITDRRLGWNIRESIAAGAGYIQIREKDLSARELLSLTRDAVALTSGTSTRILVNTRADVAAAAGAHGVHLPAGSPEARLFRELVQLVAVSCHTIEELRRAERDGADFAVFGPVFQTPGKSTPVGLEALAAAAAAVRIPVLALGGVTKDNEAECLRRGAAGVAGIRLFNSAAR